MAAVVMAHKVEGRMLVFWHSPRLGQGGKVFDLITFRTMVDADAAAPGTGLGDLQTKVGRFIRNYSLDHLEQPATERSERLASTVGKSNSPGL